MTNLTVIAAGLTALEALADADGVRVECLGGTLRQLSQGFVGPLAEASLQRVSFDKAFLGADAVTADLGICEAELDQTRLKEMMIERAARSTYSRTPPSLVNVLSMRGHRYRPGRCWLPMLQ
ncbi:hypothetical protein GCM10020255_047170 [Rhodococcus baikonurensis]